MLPSSKDRRRVIIKTGLFYTFRPPPLVPTYIIIILITFLKLQM